MSNTVIAIRFLIKSLLFNFLIREINIPKYNVQVILIPNCCFIFEIKLLHFSVLTTAV